ncbi:MULTISPECIES: exosortase F system-associated protein [unclassified Flavobacterium]|jgi:exosortase F-associated protein|uniref:exosortase F system-associated membrane protein n=1 Tax=unclassified Flavobacterium TaxID=196869 RepID=UPI000C196EB6|nr:MULTISPECIES: exosortase F system-associated protein [unclassified Flavobacterium]PIF61876.1 exosortase F-associated protein [Flavobacterium sp. 11]WKL42973.1 exosortase F system-associated protein [Flavobacterium sp. ZE23DGlu08]
MLQKILNNKLRFVQFLLLVVLLVLVRTFENQLFYDPFLDFFKKDFAKLRLPSFDSTQLFLGLLFRYTLNTVISLGIIYVIFKDVAMVKFAFVLYYFFFMILIVAFFYIVYFANENSNWVLFYVRRFLIQPIFVLLFVPGFYYQKQNK